MMGVGLGRGGPWKRKKEYVSMRSGGASGVKIQMLARAGEVVEEFRNACRRRIGRPSDPLFRVFVCNSQVLDL